MGDGAHNLLVTGDMKYEKTLLFSPTVCKFPRLESVIIESTYGAAGDNQPSRTDAEEQIATILKSTLKKKGKVLIPVFAVGRSQELMIVLEDVIRKDPEFAHIPCYLDGMIYEATAIHTAYPEYLNKALRYRIFQEKDNPFMNEVFSQVENMPQREEICDSSDPCVVLATSGMMNGGPVLEYLQAWSPEPNNSLVFVGYQAEGTLGRKIQRGNKDISIYRRGKTVNLDMNMEVLTCDGFSGHSDRRQLMNYTHNLEPKPRRMIMCHGDEAKTHEFAGSVNKRFNIKSTALSNMETIRLR